MRVMAFLLLMCSIGSLFGQDHGAFAFRFFVGQSQRSIENDFLCFSSRMPSESPLLPSLPMSEFLRTTNGGFAIKWNQYCHKQGGYMENFFFILPNNHELLEQLDAHQKNGLTQWLKLPSGVEEVVFEVSRQFHGSTLTDSFYCKASYSSAVSVYSHGDTGGPDVDAPSISRVYKQDYELGPPKNTVEVDSDLLPNDP